MKTMISNLPRDLIEEIVSRVPFKSMGEVRLTCKKWNNLSKRKSYSRMQIDKEAFKTRELESQMIVMMDHTLHLVSVVVNQEPSIEINGKLSCLEGQVKISQVFHCEGLLLCILKDDTKVTVWNPYSGQTIWIEPRYSHQARNGWYMDRYRYALGYANKKNKSCRSYKILRFFDDPVSPHKYFRAPFVWYEIYDCDSDSWTTLDVPLHWYITFYQRGVSLKGNTYFCATKRPSPEGLDDHIICFDFTRERFGPLMPLPFNAGGHDCVTLSCVREEKLAVSLTHNESNPYEFDIWITTKIEAEKVWWSQFLTLYTEPEYPISSSGGFFIDEEKKVAMGFDEDNDLTHHTLRIFGEDGYLKSLELEERSGNRTERDYKSTGMCSYVPSLVQINQPARDKRKRHSVLEKRRFGEKMLTLLELEKPVKERGGKRTKRT